MDRKKYMQEYNQSDGGKAAQQRYNTSKHGKQTRASYYRSATTTGHFIMGVISAAVLALIILIALIASGCTTHNEAIYQRGYIVDFSKPVTIKSTVIQPEEQSYELYADGD